MTASYFIAHGSPMLAIQNIGYTRDLHELGGKLGKPEAVVVFSAHWLSRTLTITSTDDTYETIYDFGGFPEELYRLTYPARGSTKLADELRTLFQAKGIETDLDADRGLDHGAWVILKHLFPAADIPVINVSVNPTLPPEKQYAIGEALATLKDRNIVIIGSGATVHNFRAMDFHRMEKQDSWAKEFDDWLIERMREWNTEDMFQYKSLAPHARIATPDYEHFLPLLIAMGTGDHAREPKVLHQSYQYGSLSHIIVEFK